MDLYKVRKELNIGVPLSQMKLRVTDYSRVSTDHLEQQNSLKNQIEHFDEMIKSNPNWEYISGYVDDGISGTTAKKRESFMQMIEDAKSGKFDLIITKEISRFSRNTLDSIKYTRELLDYGVAVLFLNDNINTALPDAELRLTIMASMAQDEIRRLSERVKFGMNRSIKNGVILGKDTLYGYKKNKNTGNLEIVEEEATIVKKVFKLYAIDNYSLSKIVRILNSENIRTSQNKSFTTTTISRMISNPKYKGYYCGKKSEIINYMTKQIKILDKDEWVVYKDNVKVPPIIDEELWNKANLRLTSRSLKFGSDYKSNKTIYQNRYILSAKIYCKNDNECFHRRKQLKASNDISWVCAKHLRKGSKVCNSPILRESEIYNIFKDIFKYQKIELNNIKNILIELYQNSVTNDAINVEINSLIKQKEKIKLKKDKILNLNFEERLTNEEFGKLNNDYNNCIKKINDKLNFLYNEKNKNITSLEKNRIIKEIDELLNSNYTTSKLIELFLDKIIVSYIEDNKIKLDIYLKADRNIIDFEIFKNKEYEFKRGYNTTSTKRYLVTYIVDLYITT